MYEIRISGEIGWDVWPDQIKKQIDKAGDEPIAFIISSPGGYVADALEIFNLIRNYPGQTKAVLSGFAMSAASYIPLACDTVEAEDNAVYMIHNTHGGVWGDHNDILNYGQMCQGLSKLFARAYAKHTGMALDDITSLMDAETYYFGSEIVDNGFANSLVQTGEEPDSDTAMASARLAFQEVCAKMNEDQPKLKKDLHRAAAMGLPAPEKNKRATPPAEPKEINMDLKTLKSKHPDLVEALKKEFETGQDKKLAEAREAGATEERARIKAVHEQSFPGFEQIVSEAMFDGESKAGDVAMKINAANRKAAETAAKGMTDDAPAPVVEPSHNGTVPQPDEKGPVTEEQAKAEWEKNKSLRTEFMGDYNLYLSYVMDQEGVKVKTLSKRGG